MNEPIISPWIFYAADVIGRVNIVINMLSLFLFLVVVCEIYTYFEYQGSDNDEIIKANEIKANENDVCLTLKLFFVVLMLNIFIPAKDTFYKMIATSYVTPANIEMIGDNVDKIADKIVDKINKVKQ